MNKDRSKIIGRKKETHQPHTLDPDALPGTGIWLAFIRGRVCNLKPF